jgi:hypothetical protein
MARMGYLVLQRKFNQLVEGESSIRRDLKNVLMSLRELQQADHSERPQQSLPGHQAARQTGLQKGANVFEIILHGALRMAL